MTHKIVALTWEAMLAEIARPSPEHTMQTSIKTENEDWSGTPTFAAAQKLAGEGWREGLAHITDALRVTAPLTLRRPAKALDVAGSYPIAAMAAAGDMLCMVAPGEEIVPRGVVRFAIGGFVSCGNSHAEITARGAALAAMVDALENAHYRVELTWALYAMGRSLPCQIDIELKSADQPLELDRVAFALIHPSMFRRVGFKLIELHYDQRKEFSTYCSPCDIPAAAYPDAVIVPSLAWDDKGYKTPDAALATITRLMAEAGVTIDGGGEL